jgi:hypothetical protein
MGFRAQHGRALLGGLDALAPSVPPVQHAVIAREVPQGLLQPGLQPQPELAGRITGPVRLIQAIARSWALSNSELANLLAYPSEMLMPGLLGGRMTFAPNTDRSDRLRVMYSIHAVLANLFVKPADEARWLRDQLPLLGNLSPLEYMLRNRIPGMLRIQEVTERGMANL